MRTCLDYNFAQSFLEDRYVFISARSVAAREWVGPEDQWSLELAFEGLCSTSTVLAID
jgi:hypothetical protein